MPAFNAFVTNSYEKDGEEQTTWTQVGVAFEHKNGSGLNLIINNGISVSGNIVLLPPDSKDKK